MQSLNFPNVRSLDGKKENPEVGTFFFAMDHFEFEPTAERLWGMSRLI